MGYSFHRNCDSVGQNLERQVGGAQLVEFPSQNSERTENLDR
jgi:hypothetical protein